MTAKKLPVTIVRGSTSKGVYIPKGDMPKDKNEWKPLVLRLMGSPDSSPTHLSTAVATPFGGFFVTRLIFRKDINEQNDMPQPRMLQFFILVSYLFALIMTKSRRQAPCFSCCLVFSSMLLYNFYIS